MINKFKEKKTAENLAFDKAKLYINAILKDEKTREIYIERLLEYYSESCSTKLFSKQIKACLSALTFSSGGLTVWAASLGVENLENYVTPC